MLIRVHESTTLLSSTSGGSSCEVCGLCYRPLIPKPPPLTLLCQTLTHPNAFHCLRSPSESPRLTRYRRFIYFLLCCNVVLQVQMPYLFQTRYLTSLVTCREFHTYIHGKIDPLRDCVTGVYVARISGTMPVNRRICLRGHVNITANFSGFHADPFPHQQMDPVYFNFDFSLGLEFSVEPHSLVSLDFCLRSL